MHPQFDKYYFCFPEQAQIFIKGEDNSKFLTSVVAILI